ncbi:MAG: hypothetical protein M3M95_06305, partial [Pseudomonadota bacterium]|nr:hypothetical protein [Pseudomonadota bacterium]
PRDDRSRDDRSRDDRPREGGREFRDRDDRPRDGQREFRDGRPERGEFRGEGNGQPRNDRGERGPRPDRFERDRDRPREGRYGERPEGRYGERPRDEAAREVGLTPSEPSAALETSGEDDGRMLRDEEGGLSPAPAFLQAAVPPADGEPRPRRRRRTRDAEGGGSSDDDGPPASEPEEV